MNHFERPLSDNDEAIRCFLTDIEYLLKITGKLHTLGKISLESADVMPHEKATQESDLPRSARVTCEVINELGIEQPDFMTAMNNRISPFGEENILYGTPEDDDQPTLFDMLNENSDDDSGGHIIKRGDEDQDND
ncbi:hypothetical protein KC953_01925 [Candidatus Saccharibacteria bacterium]|nr:hypothetical protein [Candidatus Saccharibacteria bacterium]USN97019.1 MAG: hypothetical protein H6797_02395 [Candidatus Nomurabacteria bacterium]